MTLYELAQKVRRLRGAVPAGPPSTRARAQKAYWSAGQLLYSRVCRIGGLEVPVCESAVFAAREEVLDELEALARKRGDGLFDVLEILTTMRSSHGKT
jgi:hypothetical protein